MIDKIITLALEEDTALGDITSENIFTTTSFGYKTNGLTNSLKYFS